MDFLSHVHTLLDSLAEVSDSEDDEGGREERGVQSAGPSREPTYAEEQEELKESFKGAVVKMEEEEEEGEGGDGEVLTLRKKTKQEEVCIV